VFLPFYDWEQRKLGGLSEIRRGASPRPIQDPKWFDEKSEIGWLRISDVTEQNGRIRYVEQHISEEGQKKTLVLNEPHLILSIAATVGKPVINYIGTGIHDGFIVFINPRFNKEFMFQWLEMFRPKWQRYGQPGSQVNINSDLVRNQDILIPSLDEQTKIAEFFKQLDDTIALYQKKLKGLTILKKAYLSHLFDQRIQFSGVSGEWKQSKLGNLANFSKGSGYTKSDLTDDGHPIILYGRLYTNYETIIESVDTFAVKKENSVISKGNEVIVPSSGETSEDISRASVVSIPGVILGGDLNIIEPSDEIDPVFLALTISNGKQQKELSKRAQGKSIVHLHNSDLKEVNLLFPKKEEQIKIGNFFGHLDKTIDLYQTKIDKLNIIKLGFLQKMFI